MLYKRVNLGITLNATALVLALTALDWQNIPTVIYNTTDCSTFDGKQAISVVFATFGIMLLSQLYNETGIIKLLSESLGKMIKNSKLVSSLLPAIIGFLPVAGGALMSAPIVDSETEKLKLSPEKKTYVNLWFRHIILPVYPISQILMTTAALTGVSMFLIILHQIPVVIVMVIVGYIVAFWKVPILNREKSGKSSLNSNLRDFLVSFSPILTTIVAVILLSLIGFNLSEQGFDVLIATFTGLSVLIIISKAELQVIAKLFKSRGVYGVTFAVYGAFLFKNVIKATGVSEVFKVFATNGSINPVALLAVVPCVLGFLTGSPLAGISISVSILEGVTPFLPKTASLIYMSAYLGYVIAPTHLCFTFTADYFKTPIGKAYKYVVPSFLATFTTAFLIYLLT
jgi:integral membrane protein (TIGR00529 family)